MNEAATCPKCGRRDAVDVTAFEDGVQTVMCPDCGQQPPDPPKRSGEPEY